MADGLLWLSWKFTSRFNTNDLKQSTGKQSLRSACLQHAQKKQRSYCSKQQVSLRGRKCLAISRYDHEVNLKKGSQSSDGYFIFGLDCRVRKICSTLEKTIKTAKKM